MGFVDGAVGRSHAEKLYHIIGGSGIYDLPGLENARDEAVSSPCADRALAARRHRRPADRFPATSHWRHRLSPSDINYRANIDVLKRAGVTDLISLSACGSFKEELSPALSCLSISSSIAPK